MRYHENAPRSTRWPYLPLLLTLQSQNGQWNGMLADAIHVGLKRRVSLLMAVAHNQRRRLKLSRMQSITEIGNAQGFLPFIDMAYQALWWHGRRRRSFSLPLNSFQLYLVASSVQINFGLYRRRNRIKPWLRPNTSASRAGALKAAQWNVSRQTPTRMPPGIMASADRS